MLCKLYTLQLTQHKPALLQLVDSFDVWHMKVAYVKNSTTVWLQVDNNLLKLNFVVIEIFICNINVIAKLRLHCFLLLLHCVMFHLLLLLEYL